MTNPFEPSNNQKPQGAPEWPAFPGSSDQPPAAPVPPQPTSEQHNPYQQPQQSPYQTQPQQPPQQQFPQTPPPPQGQPAAGMQFAQQPPMFNAPAGAHMVPTEKKPNILGYVALALALIGTVLACIKAVMAFGWVALPLAFILGIVALFMKNQGKAAAIAAIVISVIGGMIGGVMALVFAFKEVDNELTGGDTVVSSGSSNNEQKGIAGNGNKKYDKQGTTRENPLPVGASIENKDWVVTMNSVDLDAASKIKAENEFNDDPKPGNVQIMVNMTYQYKGNKAEGEMLIPLVEFVTSTGNTISWTDTFLMAPDELPTAETLYNGASVTGNIPFEIPAAEATKGTFAVTPGILGDKRFFATK